MGDRQERNIIELHRQGLRALECASTKFMGLEWEWSGLETQGTGSCQQVSGQWTAVSNSMGGGQPQNISQPARTANSFCRLKLSVFI